MQWKEVLSRKKGQEDYRILYGSKNSRDLTSGRLVKGQVYEKGLLN